MVVSFHLFDNDDNNIGKVIRVYTLIVSFMPAISALSGNLGLQVFCLIIIMMLLNPMESFHAKCALHMAYITDVFVTYDLIPYRK